MLQRNDHGSPATGTVLPLLFFLRIAFDFTDIDPSCLEMVRIVLLPGEEMPVHVGHLVAEELVVHLAGLDDGIDRLGHRGDFVHDGMTLFGSKIEQLSDMPFSIDDAVTLVELPGTKEGDRFLELPDQFFAELFFGMFDLVADDTGWFDGHDQLPSGLSKYRMEASDSNVLDARLN